MSKQMWIAIVVVILVVVSLIVEFLTHTFSWGMVLLQVLFLIYALVQFNKR